MEKETEIEHLLNKEGLHYTETHPNRKRNWFSNSCIVGLFALSISLNLLQVAVYRNISNRDANYISEPLSKFAKLTNNEIETEYIMYSEYANLNATERDQLWEPVGEDSGTVAVPKTWAIQMGLPQGREVPWNSSQALYAINAYHSLHCIKSIYISLRDYRLSLPQSVPEHHVFHCLDQLRADVVCAADDTLRDGASVQIRQCRDFNKLEEWMNEHPSCIPTEQDSPVLKKRVHLPVLRDCAEVLLG